MKKILAILMVMVMMFSASAMAAELTFTTGGSGGTYYAFGSVLAQYISENSDVAITAVTGEGSAANIDMLDMEFAQLASYRATLPTTHSTASSSNSIWTPPSLPSPQLLPCTMKPYSWSPAIPKSSP